MSEVIQSLSLCCPAKKCINHCETCTARQHSNPYFNLYHSDCLPAVYEYWEEVIKRLKYARDKKCSILMLTGGVEPQQDKKWLEGVYLALKSLPDPFLNIEMQTTGAFIDHNYLIFLKNIGLTTLAVSTFNIFNDTINQDIIHCPTRTLDLDFLCDDATMEGLNIRICINVTDKVAASSGVKTPAKVVAAILDRCVELHANQVTFRKMWSNPGTPEADWIKENCTEYSDDILAHVSSVVKNNGKLINKLPYGAERYDYHGLSIVIDTDSMAKDESNTATKYYIIREDGKMYSSWDSPASLVF